VTGPVLVGVDESPECRRALVWGAEEASRRHVPLRLVHAFGVPEACYGETLPPREWLASRRAESRAVLRAALDTAVLVDAGLDVSTESCLDSPIPVLLAGSETAGLVVLGTSGRTVLGEALLGSTAAALAAHGRSPFTVVRGRDGRAMGEPVVVGVDGSPANGPALELAFEEASLRGAQLVAVHTFSDANSAQVFGASRAEFGFEPLRDSETRVLAEALAGWREKYPEVTVRRVLRRDRPRRQLLDWSAMAQLVVVGSRGRGGFSGLILGSTSYALIHHASCPVLVTPFAERAAAAASGGFRRRPRR
jgi:nucleotide-binding universal stress UspA family protein